MKTTVTDYINSATESLKFALEQLGRVAASDDASQKALDNVEVNIDLAESELNQAKEML